MVLQFGFGFDDAVGTAIQWLSAVFQGIVDVFLGLWDFMLQALQFLYDGIKLVFDFLYGALKALANHLRAIADWIHTRVLGKIVEWVTAIKARLHQIFDPILTVLRKIRKIQDYYFNTILKPVFDFIQRLRRVLLIFRLLHFKFAQQLDTYLAQQEAKIARAFLDARAKMNELINWVNLIVDPFGNIYASVFLNTAVTSINALWALLWGAQKGTLTQQQQQAQAAAAQSATPQNARAHIAALAATGLTADDQTLFQQALQSYHDAGYTLTLTV